MEDKKGFIISGFAGIGKSTSALMGDVVDLESTPFREGTGTNWYELYVKVANHMKDNGYTVCISAHTEVRKEMQNKNIPYTFVTPSIELKEEYLQRYKDRKNNGAFINSMNKQFGKFVMPLRGENVIVLRAREHLDDVLHLIEGRKYITKIQ